MDRRDENRAPRGAFSAAISLQRSAQKHRQRQMAPAKSL